ncbi:ERCC4 domain-containing protein [Halomonas sp.]|uniref:ERCC4 domain-containing protein n=1 Tax=Halomonas sp. TaxID=1486246 RepID=UPI0035647A75
MSVFAILVDNREQKPWTFDGYPVETRSVTLETADYTLERFCDYDEENDTYIPELGVERKAPSDFLNSITHGRERFKSEIIRAEYWDDELQVIIEAPWSKFQNRYSDVLKYRKVYPNQISGTVEEWEKWYNVVFQFADSRLIAERDCLRYLMTAYRNDSM